MVASKDVKSNSRHGGSALGDQGELGVGQEQTFVIIWLKGSGSSDTVFPFSAITPSLVFRVSILRPNPKPLNWLRLVVIF